MENPEERACAEPAPSAWEQSLQQSVQHVFSAQQQQQEQQSNVPQQRAPPASVPNQQQLPQTVSSRQYHTPMQPGHGGGFNAAMDAATGLAAGHMHGMHAVQQRVDLDGGGFAITLSPKTHALLFNPIAAYAVALVGLWLVLFVCLIVSSPGFVQERVEQKDGAVRYVLSIKRAALFGALFAALFVAAPAVYTRLRSKRSAPTV